MSREEKKENTPVVAKCGNKEETAKKNEKKTQQWGAKDSGDVICPTGQKGFAIIRRKKKTWSRTKKKSLV